MPSVMPLSRTASSTSSVMSRTVSPPVVRSWVSRWKTFTAPIVRVPAASGTGEPSIPGHTARGGRLAFRDGRRPTAGGRADADRSGHALLLVARNGAVHLVALACGERHLHGLARAGADAPALHLVATPARLDGEGVRQGALVRDLEGVRSRLGHGD